MDWRGGADPDGKRRMHNGRPGFSPTTGSGRRRLREGGMGAGGFDLVDPHDDRRDVVEAAAPVGVRDHLGDPDLGRTFALENLGQLVVLEHAGEAVGSEQDYVALPEGAEIDVRHHVFVGADAPGDDVAVGMGPGLLGGEQTSVDLFLDVAVIFGELLEDAVAKQIRPAVADLADQKPACRDLKNVFASQSPDN